MYSDSLVLMIVSMVKHVTAQTFYAPGSNDRVHVVLNVSICLSVHTSVRTF